MKKLPLLVLLLLLFSLFGTAQFGFDPRQYSGDGFGQNDPFGSQQDSGFGQGSQQGQQSGFGPQGSSQGFGGSQGQGFGQGDFGGSGFGSQGGFGGHQDFGSPFGELDPFGGDIGGATNELVYLKIAGALQSAVFSNRENFKTQCLAEGGEQGLIDQIKSSFESGSLTVKNVCERYSERAAAFSEEICDLSKGMSLPVPPNIKAAAAAAGVEIGLDMSPADMERVCVTVTEKETVKLTERMEKEFDKQAERFLKECSRMQEDEQRRDKDEQRREEFDQKMDEQRRQMDEQRWEQMQNQFNNQGQYGPPQGQQGYGPPQGQYGQQGGSYPPSGQYPSPPQGQYPQPPTGGYPGQPPDGYHPPDGGQYPPQGGDFPPPQQPPQEPPPEGGGGLSAQTVLPNTATGFYNLNLQDVPQEEVPSQGAGFPPQGETPPQGNAGFPPQNNFPPQGSEDQQGIPSAPNQFGGNIPDQPFDPSGQGLGQGNNPFGGPNNQGSPMNGYGGQGGQGGFGQGGQMGGYGGQGGSGFGGHGGQGGSGFGMGPFSEGDCESPVEVLTQKMKEEYGTDSMMGNAETMCKRMALEMSTQIESFRVRFEVEKERCLLHVQSKKVELQDAAQTCNEAIEPQKASELITKTVQNKCKLIRFREQRTANLADSLNAAVGLYDLSEQMGGQSGQLVEATALNIADKQADYEKAKQEKVNIFSTLLGSQEFALDAEKTAQELEERKNELADLKENLTGSSAATLDEELSKLEDDITKKKQLAESHKSVFGIFGRIFG